jgi:hypothetical protein
MGRFFCLVVLIPLKNDGVRQLEGLSDILWKIKNDPNHQAVFIQV